MKKKSSMENEKLEKYITWSVWLVLRCIVDMEMGDEPVDIVTVFLEYDA